MEKVIKYKFLAGEIGHGTTAEQILFVKSMPWTESNEEIAKKEAYNGEYEIVDVEGA